MMWNKRKDTGVMMTNQHLLMAQRDRYDLFPFVDFAFNGVAMREDIDPTKFQRVFLLPDLSPMLSISVSAQTDPELVNRIRDAYARVESSGRFNQLLTPLLETPATR